MFDRPYLVPNPLLFRIALLVALLVLVHRYMRKGVQNGVLIGLITGITSITLFSGSEIMRGLPNIISADRIVWPVVLAIFLVKRWRGQTERLPLDWIELGILAFIAVMLASMIRYGTYVDTDGDWSLFSIVRGYVFPFIAYFIVRRAAGTPKHFHAFIVGVGYFTLYLALTGIAEGFKVHKLVFPQFIINPDVGIHFGQARGLFLNASIYGLALATALPLLVWLYFNDRAPRRYLWVLVAALSAISLLLTSQRAAWLSAMIAAGVTALAWPSQRVFLTWCLLFIVICGFWFASEGFINRLQDQQSIDYRVRHIERGLTLFREHPLLGVGINRYQLEIEQYSSWRHSGLTTHAHNTWITLLAELGLVGLLTYLLPFGFVLFKSFIDYLRFPQRRALLGILVAITLAFLVMALSINLRTSLYSNGLLFTLWAIILARLGIPSEERVVAYRKILNAGQIPANRLGMLQPITAARFRSRWP